MPILTITVQFFPVLQPFGIGMRKQRIQRFQKIKFLQTLLIYHNFALICLG